MSGTLAVTTTSRWQPRRFYQFDYRLRDFIVTRQRTLSESQNVTTPLHVAIVSTQKHWHGGEMQASLLAEGLRRRGHRCSILARETGEFAKRMRDMSFDVSTFPGSGRSVRAIWNIRAALRRLQPDVLHANDAHALTAGGIAAWRLPIGLHAVARRVDFPIRSRRRYQTFADGLICVSRGVVDVCKQAGLSAETLHVVHDGVEPTFAESGSRELGRQSMEVSDDQTLLLTVAKLTDHKGHAYLLRALPQILTQHPNVVLALAGDGELTSELQSLACELNVDSHVRFLGYRHDVANLLAAADVIVQPSHLEGLCSSLIDAMLAARPIVATRAGGIPDLLQTNVGEADVAWLVETKSSTALVTAIGEALSNPDVAIERGEAARRRALQNFTADHMVDGTLNVYAKIAKQLHDADRNAKRHNHQAAERLRVFAADVLSDAADCSVSDAA